MDINLARTFLAVAETGRFVEAAERVHVNQLLHHTQERSRLRFQAIGQSLLS